MVAGLAKFTVSGVAQAVNLTSFTPANTTPHGLALTQPDGGSNYWQQYGHPAGFLPLGAYFQAVYSQSDVDLDKAAGFNLYISTDHQYDDLSLLAPNDMYAWLAVSGQGGALASYDSWKTNPRVTGWVLHDEQDMLGDTDAAAQQGIDALTAERATVPADGRLVQANFGKGVAFWHPDSYVDQFVNNFGNVVSDDIYWHSGPELMTAYQAGSFLHTPPTETATEAEVRLSANYGLLVDKMRRFANGKPVLNYIDAAPMSSWGVIGAPQQRSAAWHSLIAGARGLGYFVTALDNNGTVTSPKYHRVNAAMRAQLGTLNAEIASHAASLNSPTVTGLVTHATSVRTLSKWDGTNYTIFVGSMQAASQTVTFTLGAPATSVQVLGEARTLPVTAGQFTDTFADGNAVHIYRPVL